MEKLIKFGFVGVINFTITLIVYNILIHFGVNYIVANSIGYIAGMVNSYVWNNIWVFQAKSKSLKVAIKFIIVNLIVMGINNILLFILVKDCGLNKTIAQGVALVITTLINFAGNRFWTFREKSN
ncbi:GtrA family protein [uncultured Clostridium sp.]|uniref:GtrA family protein n=1 Tax=uncultured Clostridium sp. TaxID=59620 RepID=UPI002626796B|nr:GtrA family protein [uncultured Clostridium sp.]